MKLIAAATLALLLAGCAAQAGAAPRNAAPSRLQSCQRDFDCDGARSCVEGYCRRVN